MWNLRNVLHASVKVFAGGDIVRFGGYSLRTIPLNGRATIPRTRKVEALRRHHGLRRGNPSIWARDCRNLSMVGLVFRASYHVMFRDRGFVLHPLPVFNQQPRLSIRLTQAVTILKLRESLLSGWPAQLRSERIAAEY